MAEKIVILGEEVYLELTSAISEKYVLITPFLSPG